MMLKFYPSRFIGYISNSMDAHLENESRDGRETNLTISEIIGNKPVPNSEFDKHYKEYCETLDFTIDDAFTAAGGWFFLTQFELIKSWAGSKAELVDLIFSKGFDAKRTESNTRVSSAMRIIDARRGKEALMKIRDSMPINREHPEAERMASELLLKYFC